MEHHTQGILPFKHFLLRVGRYTLFASALILISLGIGTVGYHYIGALRWIDSFQMSCMILTGMGPIDEMKTDAAKLFSSFYALYSGLAFLSVTAVFLAPIVHRLLHILQVDHSTDSKD